MTSTPRTSRPFQVTVYTSVSTNELVIKPFWPSPGYQKVARAVSFSTRYIHSLISISFGIDLLYHTYKTAVSPFFLSTSFCAKSSTAVSGLHRSLDNPIKKQCKFYVNKRANNKYRSVIGSLCYRVMALN